MNGFSFISRKNCKTFENTVKSLKFMPFFTLTAFGGLILARFTTNENILDG